MKVFVNIGMFNFHFGHLHNLAKFVNYFEAFTYLINRFNAKFREINR